MAIRSLSDLQASFDAGKFHVQRFQKNAGTAHAKIWADPTFASGQPAYDAHVGSPATFTPCVAQKNDAIFFPGIGAGEERYLAEAQMWASQATFNGPISVVFFDLLGYYPLIDGDSTDTQAFDNTQTLPRYTSGEGVFPVMVSHVAPAVQNGLATIEYTDSDGNAQTRTIDVPNNGQNLVCSGSRTTTGATSCTLSMALNDGIKGVRSIDSLTYTTPPGGLHCIYLVRVLGTMQLGDNAVCGEKNFITGNAFSLPRIHDGAWIGWFDMLATGTTARTVTWFGNMTFVWG